MITVNSASKKWKLHRWQKSPKWEVKKLSKNFLITWGVYCNSFFTLQYSKIKTFSEITARFDFLPWDPNNLAITENLICLQGFSLAVFNGMISFPTLAYPCHVIWCYNDMCAAKRANIIANTRWFWRKRFYQVWSETSRLVKRLFILVFKLRYCFP